jgi:hypothetical protein
MGVQLFMGEWVDKVWLGPSQDNVKAVYTGSKCASDVFSNIGVQIVIDMVWEWWGLACTVGVENTFVL